MLRKLLKYEFKSIFKFLVIFYVLALFFAGIVRGLSFLDSTFILNIISQVCAGAAVAMIVNILINNIMRSWVRFKNNLYADESYLTHTLPVSKGKLYSAKAITTIVSLLVSFALVALTLYITYYSKENMSTLKNLLLPVAKMYDTTIMTILLLCLALIYLQFMTITKCGYFGLIVGHKKNSHKLAWSILWGFILYIGIQLLLLFIIYLIALFVPSVMDLFTTNKVLDINSLKILLYGAMAIYSVVILVLFYVNIKLLNKGVDIE